ncbi:hypothetical protein ZIOFF_035527 [Zingiber officinale]|uniref:Uncharacterized protein n=1 Tax=Zingiber officinale TaxID=94328 RepID=A0A8J5L7U3_ZINOF|nr:hypothetical protein ZIOFF_035527 [Zingiber officinale]
MEMNDNNCCCPHNFHCCQQQHRHQEVPDVGAVIGNCSDDHNNIPASLQLLKTFSRWLEIMVASKEKVLLAVWWLQYLLDGWKSSNNWKRPLDGQTALPKGLSHGGAWLSCGGTRGLATTTTPADVRIAVGLREPHARVSFLSSLPSHSRVFFLHSPLRVPAPAAGNLLLLLAQASQVLRRFPFFPSPQPLATPPSHATTTAATLLPPASTETPHQRRSHRAPAADLSSSRNPSPSHEHRGPQPPILISPESCPNESDSAYNGGNYESDFSLKKTAIWRPHARVSFLSSLPSHSRVFFLHSPSRVPAPAAGKLLLLLAQASQVLRRFPFFPSPQPLATPPSHAATTAATLLPPASTETPHQRRSHRAPAADLSSSRNPSPSHEHRGPQPPILISPEPCPNESDRMFLLDDFIVSCIGCVLSYCYGSCVFMMDQIVSSTNLEVEDVDSMLGSVSLTNRISRTELGKF